MALGIQIGDRLGQVTGAKHLVVAFRAVFGHEDRHPRIVPCLAHHRADHVGRYVVAAGVQRHSGGGRQIACGADTLPHVRLCAKEVVVRRGVVERPSRIIEDTRVQRFAAGAGDQILERERHAHFQPRHRGLDRVAARGVRGEAYVADLERIPMK